MDPGYDGPVEREFAMIPVRRCGTCYLWDHGVKSFLPYRCRRYPHPRTHFWHGCSSWMPCNRPSWWSVMLAPED